MIKAILFIALLTINYFALAKEVEWCQTVFAIELIIGFGVPALVGICKLVD
jgi:hypothetical protein